MREQQARPGKEDIWLIQSFNRGGGVLMGRITPRGERLFYFRYTDPNGNRPFLPVGPYHPKGLNGLTVAQALEKASELSALYRSGVRDLRQHFEREGEAATREAERVARDQTSAEAAAARRITVEQLFEQWARVELAPKMQADGSRTGRKDGGEWVRQSFGRRVFPKLGTAPVEEVRKADLMAILDEVVASGKSRTANVLMTDLRQMFRFALDREMIARNPLDGVLKRNVGGKETERDRVLTDEEIRTLWRVAPTALRGRSALAVWLILSTPRPSRNN